MAGLKRYNGSAWVPAVWKRYNGSSWVNALVKMWNGSAWVVLNPAVTLSGENITHNTAGTGTVGLRVDSGGTLSKLVGAAYSQIDAATDWIIPNASSADKTYHVRATRTGGVEPAFGTGSSAAGTWLAVSTVPLWKISDTVDTTIIFTLDISDDGGTTTIDSGSYTLAITGH